MYFVAETDRVHTRCLEIYTYVSTNHYFIHSLPQAECESVEPQQVFKLLFAVFSANLRSLICCECE
jgi:hypothetical protein